jgi:hypothetical protein
MGSLVGSMLNLKFPEILAVQVDEVSSLDPICGNFNEM